MKKILLTTICIAFATFSFSQQVSRYVVASGGNYSADLLGNSLSSTIGETMVTTLTSASNILTQGFQQSFSAPVDPAITITNPMDGSIHYCLDNPTIGFVVSNFTVGLPGSGGDGHIHYSVNGTPGPMQYDTTHIQLTNLANGSYQFIIELVDNSHSSFSPVISDTVNFTINIILGCTDSTATNYNASATCDDGSCTSPIYGCMDATATNYDPTATVDDGSCCYTNWVTLVMTDSYGDGWNGNTWTATSATGGNTYGPFTLSNGYSDSISFCMDHDCFDIICDFGSWQSEVGWTLIENGTSVLTGGAPAIMQIGIGSGSCTTGCTDSLACNYDPLATIDDGSCTYPAANADCNGCLPGFVDDGNGNCVAAVYGCMDPLALNYYSGATADDGSCVYVAGCMDATACNYDPLADIDDGSCEWTSCSGTCANAAPTGLYASNVLQNRATINWDNMNDANCMVDQYRIKYRDITSSGAWTQKNMGQPLNSCLWGANNTDKLILNLTPSTTYQYQMKAWYCDGSGMGVGSAWSAMETFTTEDDCPNVGNLAVSTPSTTKATFYLG